MVTAKLGVGKNDRPPAQTSAEVIVSSPIHRRRSGT